ncbi:hypothetical protein TNCV_1224361 [Trichonephila clavipes]|nr:hypothetical protein TNCV_1224361 [Trichonephila clavipes]
MQEKFSYCRNVPGFRGNSSGIPRPEVDFGWKYPRKWNLAKDVFRRKDEKDRFVETVWSRSRAAIHLERVDLKEYSC